MFKMLADPNDDVQQTLDAVELALELAKWYTFDKTEDNLLEFLWQKTNDPILIRKAASMFVAAKMSQPLVKV